MDIAPRTEIAARPGDDDRLHFGRVDKLPEQVAQLGIALERQRVLAIRTVQRDRRHAVFKAPVEMRRSESFRIQCNISPPAMAMVWPVMERLSSDRKSTRLNYSH